VPSESSDEKRGKIEIPKEVLEDILSRQDFKCYNCNEPIFGPTIPFMGKIRQIKSRKSGHGYHKHKQLKDFKNLAYYCPPCYKNETATKIKSLRINRAKLNRYEKIWQENPRYTDFTMFVNEALEVFTNQEYYKDLIQERKEEGLAEAAQNEMLAFNFREIKKMYNERKDDLEFANEVVRYFDYYTPKDKSPSFDGWGDEERRLIKKRLDRKMKRIIEKKQAGYKYYKENPQDFWD